MPWDLWSPCLSPPSAGIKDHTVPSNFEYLFLLAYTNCAWKRIPLWTLLCCPAFCQHRWASHPQKWSMEDLLIPLSTEPLPSFAFWRCEQTLSKATCRRKGFLCHPGYCPPSREVKEEPRRRTEAEQPCLLTCSPDVLSCPSHTAQAHLPGGLFSIGSQENVP